MFLPLSPNRFARFWVDKMDAATVKQFVLSKEPAGETPSAKSSPAVKTDAQGWPASATWSGMSQPLFTEGRGDLVAVKVNSFAPRWPLQDIWNTTDKGERQRLLGEKVQITTTQADQSAKFEETPHTLCYTQPLSHPRFKWATRRLELWKGEPRARLTVRFNRVSSFDPELLCVVNPLPCDGTLPRMSSGGLAFVPFSDQLGNSCRDYFAIDGWAQYTTPAGHWLWVTRDAPLVTLDGPHPKGRLLAPPARTGRMLAIVFDNFWYTNFQGDSPGVMEFQFDLVWREHLAGDAAVEKLASTLVSEPVLVLNPLLPEDPLFIERLYRP